MCLLAAISKPLVMVLLTEKWEGCVIFLQIGCAAYMLRPLQIINNCIIRASGRSALLLKLDLLKKGIGIILLLIMMPYGVEAIAWSYVALNVISTFINIYPNKDILKYGYIDQFKDLGNNMIVGILMGAIVWLLTFLPMSNFIILPMQLVVGIIIYILLSKLFKIESYSYILKLANEHFLHRLKKNV